MLPKSRIGSAEIALVAADNSCLKASTNLLVRIWKEGPVGSPGRAPPAGGRTKKACMPVFWILGRFQLDHKLYEVSIHSDLVFASALNLLCSATMSSGKCVTMDLIRPSTI